MNQMEWRSFITYGKQPMILFVVLFFFLFFRKQKGPKGRLVWYGAISTALVVCPVTAWLLLKYQTSFYDYSRLWGLVPMTIMIAFGFTVFWAENRRDSRGFKTLLYHGAIIGMWVFVLYACSGLLAGEFPAAEREIAGKRAAGQKAEVRQVLDQICENTEGDICLWAPADILAESRRYSVGDRDIRVLYGRNLWDISLNAYSYDTYPEEFDSLYTFMESDEKEGLRYYLEMAHDYGANVCLLPREGCDDRELMSLQEPDATIQVWEKYYFICFP